jgi:hypothetical protein
MIQRDEIVNDIHIKNQGHSVPPQGFQDTVAWLLNRQLDQDSYPR